MSLNAISSLESARRKFFMNSTYIISRKLESNVFFAQDAKMSLTAIQLAGIGEKKIFMNSTYIMSRKKESNVFGLRWPK